MSSFEVLVRRVDGVKDHPNADRLSILTILGYEAISAKNEDGTHRFAVGDRRGSADQAGIPQSSPAAIPQNGKPRLFDP